MGKSRTREPTIPLIKPAIASTRLIFSSDSHSIIIIHLCPIIPPPSPFIPLSNTLPFPRPIIPMIRIIYNDCKTRRKYSTVGFSCINVTCEQFKSCSGCEIRKESAMADRRSIFWRLVGRKRKRIILTGYVASR